LQQLVCIALLSRRRRSLAWLPSFEEIHGHLQKLLPSTTRDLDDSAAEDGCEALKEASFEGVSSARLQLEAGIHWEALVKLSGLAEGEEGTLAMRFWEPPWANRVGQLDRRRVGLAAVGHDRGAVGSRIDQPCQRWTSEAAAAAAAAARSCTERPTGRCRHPLLPLERSNATSSRTHSCGV